MSDETASAPTSEVGFGVNATLSIDNDPVEVVHERLLRKGKQNALRASVIDELRGMIDAMPTVEEANGEGLAQSSVLTTADKFKLGLILNRDCDTVE